jgi:sugar phosphate permease
MTVYFCGAAMGSALAARAWVRWGWNGVSVLALGLIVLAALRHMLGDHGVERPAPAEDALLEA